MQARPRAATPAARLPSERRARAPRASPPGPQPRAPSLPAKTPRGEDRGGGPGRKRLAACPPGFRDSARQPRVLPPCRPPSPAPPPPPRLTETREPLKSPGGWTDGRPLPARATHAGASGDRCLCTRLRQAPAGLRDLLPGQYPYWPAEVGPEGWWERRGAPREPVPHSPPHEGACSGLQ